MKTVMIINALRKYFIKIYLVDIIVCLNTLENLLNPIGVDKI